MITPWYEHGTSEEYIAKAQPDLQALIDLLSCVSRGLHYLHQLDPVVVHGDLKPSNILIDDKLRPRICDFGLARIVNEEGGGGFTTTTPHLGTARYAAPEILMTPDDAAAFMPSTASDIYSLGSVIYQFFTGSIPYKDKKTGVQIIADVVRERKPAKRPPALTNIETLAWNLFEICWSTLPEQRPNAREVGLSLDQIEMGWLATQKLQSSLSPCSSSEARNEILTGSKSPDWSTNPRYSAVSGDESDPELGMNYPEERPTTAPPAWRTIHQKKIPARRPTEQPAALPPVQMQIPSASAAIPIPPTLFVSAPPPPPPPICAFRLPSDRDRPQSWYAWQPDPYWVSSSPSSTSTTPLYEVPETRPLGYFGPELSSL